MHNFFSNCEQIWRKKQFCSILLNRSLMGNFKFCTVTYILMVAQDIQKFHLIFTPPYKETGACKAPGFIHIPNVYVD